MAGEGLAPFPNSTRCRGSRPRYGKGSGGQAVFFEALDWAQRPFRADVCSMSHDSMVMGTKERYILLRLDVILGEQSGMQITDKNPKRLSIAMGKSALSAQEGEGSSSSRGFSPSELRVKLSQTHEWHVKTCANQSVIVSKSTAPWAGPGTGCLAAGRACRVCGGAASSGSRATKSPEQGILDAAQVQIAGLGPSFRASRGSGRLPEADFSGGRAVWGRHTVFQAP